MDHGYCICYLNWFHIYGSRWIVTIKDNIFEHRFKKITDTFRCLRITNFKLHFFIVSDDIQEDLSDHYEIKYDCAEGVFQLLKYNLFKNKCERNQFIIVRTKITHNSFRYSTYIWEATINLYTYKNSKIENSSETPSIDVFAPLTLVDILSPIEFSKRNKDKHIWNVYNEFRAKLDFSYEI